MQFVRQLVALFVLAILTGLFIVVVRFTISLFY